MMSIIVLHTSACTSQIKIKVISFTLWIDLFTIMSFQSLLNYLRIESLIIHNHRCRESEYTKSKLSSWLKSKIIEVWNDFEYEFLQYIYSDDLQRLLQRDCDFRDCSILEASFFREIFDENFFKSVLEAWNQNVVSHALAVVQADLEHSDSREKLDMMRGGQVNYSDEDSCYNSDWAEIRRSGRIRTCASSTVNETNSRIYYLKTRSWARSGRVSR